MDFGMEAGIFLAYTACLLAICFFGRLLLAPMKVILRILVNSIFGGIILILIRLLCINFEIFLPVNVFTAMIAGLLGVPGIVGILVFFNFSTLF